MLTFISKVLLLFFPLAITFSFSQQHGTNEVTFLTRLQRRPIFVTVDLSKKCKVSRYRSSVSSLHHRCHLFKKFRKSKNECKIVKEILFFFRLSFSLTHSFFRKKEDISNRHLIKFLILLFIFTVKVDDRREAFLVWGFWNLPSKLNIRRMRKFHAMPLEN